ncbi:Chaperone required for the assembly of the F1-ATPase [Salinihabitans flavidus]|uniref:Chaperone required for the assembly of the F1-ATPase n=1 Tax=Salinihabitans flavidus TaxID=569882 RepID=A0A1H8VJP3_9RHOB|nr:ATP12 family protein [Salinihabitans flavidus]SEP15520.1 Chaperone required for the assembly of the F1-ATPase [Salinihabitans flavidus]
MSGWKNRRFWKDVAVVEEGDAFGVALDGRSLRTPAKAPLLVPTRAMAEAIAAEWQAQSDEVDPRTMPVTRSANAAIDKVAPQKAEVAEMIADYGGCDLLCYRAESPEALCRRQAEAWDPLLDWADRAMGARLHAVAGVMFQPQEAAALRALSAPVHEMTAFELAAFHDLVSLSGSLVIGFASIHRLHPLDALWEMSRIDERWQEEQWGRDEEAQAVAEARRAAFHSAGTVYCLVNDL